MERFRPRLAEAVRFFWEMRNRQDSKQGSVSGKRDAGNRSAVTGGSHCNGFAEVIHEILRTNGLNDAQIFHKRQKSAEDRAEHHRLPADRGTQLPGYFRPTKDWDLVAVVGQELIASIEFKSHVGPSFGNNFNNRTEEALGNATDIWTAFREGAFKPSSRPWLGYFMHRAAPWTKWSGCKLESVTIKASPGERVDVEVVVSYAKKGRTRTDRFKEDSFPWPERCLTWDDLGTLFGGMKE